MTDDLNAVARQIVQDTIQAKEDYDSPSKTGVELSKRNLEKAIKNCEKLKRHRGRERTEDLCKYNLAAAFIGVGNAQGEKDMKNLKRKMDNIHKENPDDRHCLLFRAYVDLHLGMVEGETDTRMNYIDEALQGVEILRTNKSSYVSERSELIAIEESALTRAVSLSNKAVSELLKRLDRDKSKSRHSEIDTRRERCVRYMLRLEYVYRDNIDISEWKEKRVGNLMALAEYQTEVGERESAMSMAIACYDIFHQNWAWVSVGYCNDLGIILMECKCYKRAAQCFQRMQSCCTDTDQTQEPYKNLDLVKSYMFQNLAVIRVIQLKYEHQRRSAVDRLFIVEKTYTRAAERRVHLYLNLGFVWSQQGRMNIWKTFEAYHNAAVFAKDKEFDKEPLLRAYALDGLVKAAMVIKEMKDLVDFLSHPDIAIINCTTSRSASKSSQTSTDTQQSVSEKLKSPNYRYVREIPQVMELMQAKGAYSKRVESIQKFVLKIFERGGNEDNDEEERAEKTKRKRKNNIVRK